MQDINRSPYSRCISPECGKKYWGWAPLENCGCGSPTERYVPNVEEIRERNRGHRKGDSTSYAPRKDFPLRRFDKWE